MTQQFHQRMPANCSQANRGASPKSRPASIIFLLIIVLLAQSCFKPYYKTNTKYVVDEKLTTTILDTTKYLVLHLNHGNYSMDSISVHDNVMEGSIKPLAAKHAFYLKPRPKTSPTFRHKRKKEVLSEVHIYVQQLDPEPHLVIPLKYITRIDAYKPNKGKTFAAVFFSVTGIGIVGIVGLALVLTIAYYQ